MRCPKLVNPEVNGIETIDSGIVARGGELASSIDATKGYMHACDYCAGRV
jgi:hypothetical protein